MLAFLLVLAVLAAVLESWSLKNALSNLRYSLRISMQVVEPMQPFALVSRVENRSLLPRGYLRLVESLPAGARVFPPLEPGEGEQGEKLIRTFFMLPRACNELRTEVVLAHRGRYFFGSSALSGGDFLGLRDMTEYFTRSSEVVVLPARAQDCAVYDALGGFLGDISVRRFMMEDPVLTLGFNEYTGREPQKAISWTRSAAMGRLMVKRQDYTLEPSVSVLLSTEGGTPAQKERCFSLARTVCEQLEQKGVKYAFQTNAAAAGAIGAWSQAGEGLGERHLMTILENLGRATYDCIYPCADLLMRAAKKAEQGRSHIVISPEGALDARALARLRELTGGQVLLIEAEKEP